MLQSFSFELVLGQLWRRQWHSTPVLLPGKSHGQRVLVGCSPRGCYELDMTEWLHFHFSLLCIGEGNGNPLQCSCLENLRDGGAWWAAIYGVAQSLTRLMWLSSGSSNRPTKHENLPLEGTRQDWAVFLGYQKGRRENSGSHWDNILTLSWVILKEGHHSVHSSSERKLRLFLRTRDRKLNFQCCCIFMFFFFLFFTFHSIFKCQFRHIFFSELLNPQFNPLWICYKRFLCHFLLARFLPDSEDLQDMGLSFQNMDYYFTINGITLK